jgi:hypothetical protein
MHRAQAWICEGTKIDSCGGISFTFGKSTHPCIFKAVLFVLRDRLI